ncbi:MAG: GT4 family glycosyltransferase PelF [Clostridia bacterium]|nr:GT4 family glycosyltransferase PelF [Clostridia bacterium]
MRICLVLEGCYPYINGGVSTWMHQYITEMPEHEFVLWVIGAKAEDRDKFVYTLPPNVVEIEQVFLDDALRVKDSGMFNHSFNEKEKEALRRLVSSDKPDWDLLFDMYQVRRINPMSYLKSESFLEILTETCHNEFPFIAFSDTFHSVRSRLLPVLYLMGTKIPKADCYHAICTGYGGLLASMAAHVMKKPMLLTEHGIYTREREEEIIRAKWVARAFKPHWIDFFYMLSDLTYERAFRVTSLFTRAMHTQIDMGCDAYKCRVIENGISYERLCNIPLKEDDGFVDIGAVVRLAPIKDIKTMIYAFFELCARCDNVRLHIMGGVDDQEYADECYALVKQLGLEDKIIFTGRVNIIEYFEKLDFTLLTSISEGQPLSVLESFAARRPAVTTDVGCCSELLNGKPGDTLGKAGYFAPPMQREKLADAMELLCESRELRLKMGEIGQKRTYENFRYNIMLTKYRDLYKEVENEWPGSVLN